MKKILSVLLVAAMVMLAVSCQPAQTPRSVAEAFLSAFTKMDITTASTYATESSKKTLAMLEGMLGMMSEEDKAEAAKATFEIINVVENGDKATVTYKASGEEGEKTIDLVKVEGKWLVDFKKTT